MSRHVALLALAVALTSGCSIVPEPREPSSLVRSSAEALPQRLALAPIAFEARPLEVYKGYDVKTVAATRTLQGELVRWLEAHQVFGRARSLVGETPLDEAWEERDDLILEVALRRFRTTYEGHNPLWLPNAVLWWLIMAPAWFVPTEIYSLTVDVQLTVRSVHTERVLHTAQLPIRVDCHLNEFGRGFQFFGFLWPDNDAGNWEAIAEAMIPAAHAEIAAAVTEELRGPFRERLGRGSPDAGMTMALIVGASVYEDASTRPPLPFAASDAAEVAAVLKTTARLGDRHLKQLRDRSATRAAFLAELARLRDYSRAGDQVLIYFAGYGTRAADGSPTLLFHDQGLSLAELAEELKTIRGRALVLLDTSFDGAGRSLKGGERRAGDLAPLTAIGAATLAAASRGDELVAPEHAGASLFAFHLTRALGGAADANADGRVTPRELQRLLAEHVVADAAYAGKRQRPLAAGLDSPFALVLEGTQ